MSGSVDVVVVTLVVDGVTVLFVVVVVVITVVVVVDVFKVVGKMVSVKLISVVANVVETDAVKSFSVVVAVVIKSIWSLSDLSCIVVFTAAAVVTPATTINIKMLLIRITTFLTSPPGTFSRLEPLEQSLVPKTTPTAKQIPCPNKPCNICIRVEILYLVTLIKRWVTDFEFFA